MNNLLSKIAFLIVLVLIIGCTTKKENDVIYKKPPPEKLDATCTWLREEENFFKPKYKTVLYTYYNHKIEEKNYLAAAKALEVVAWNNAQFVTYDQKFFETINHFSSLYRSKIPVAKTRFIDMYYGDYYTDKGSIDKAIAAYAKNTNVKVVDYKSCFWNADSYRTIGWCYFQLGKQDLAMKNYFKSLEYFKKTDNIAAISSIYSYTAAIYDTSKKYAEAEQLYNKALVILNKNRKENSTNIFNTLYNKINLYDRSMNYKKRDPLIDSVYWAFKKSKLINPSNKISINTYYAIKLIDQNKLKEAKIILEELKLDVELLDSKISNQEYRVALAVLESKQNKGTGIKNKILLVEAIQELKKISNHTRVRDLYAVLYDDAVNTNNYKKAMLYNDSIHIATDSMSNQSMANKVVELETKYQTQKKQQQIVLQKKEILSKNTTIALLISSIIGVLFIGLAFILRQKQKKLKQEKQTAQQYTKQLLEKTEEERKRIASDLHDSVSHELLSLKNSFEEKTEDTNKKIDAIINDIRIISRNLHPIMFDKVGLKSSIEQLVERAQSVNHFMVTAAIDYSNSLTSAKELQVYRILQEALSNIIKYSDALAAKITIVEKTGVLFIEIKDNGKGFNVSETLNNTTAFGLHNIIERTRVIGGAAKIISDKNGTIITLTIKK